MQTSDNTVDPGNSAGNVIVSLILVVLLVASLGFGFWAYASMSDYKNNVDKKIADASAIVKQQTASEKDKEYLEKDKSPFKQYTSPDSLGSVKFQYPKTWSAYIVEANSNDDTPINGYFEPDFVPDITGNSTYSLRFKVVNQSFNNVLTDYSDKVSGGTVKSIPYRAPKVSSILGTRLDGPVNDGQKDSMVIIPIRDKTLEIWTESDQYLADFNNTVLPSLTFSP
ncbi:MAG TPA: hypothetical protein VLF39_00475 [Candidatus Saccharimonadales bacterium]|nr:hypothetical protein [Candidatus Saccharimonadales bacterium]